MNHRQSRVPADRAGLNSPGQWLFFALLLGIAPLGNAAALEFFYGVEFIFGSIAVFLAAARLGLVPAVLVGIAGGLQTVAAWGHPIGLLTYTLEALVVAALYARGRHNLVLSDLLFWVVLGAPLILAAYPLLVGVSPEAAALLALKQPLNGLFNALVAGLFLLLFSHVTFRVGGNWAEHPARLAGLIFHVLLGIILLAGAIPTLLQGYDQRETLIANLDQQLLRVAQGAARGVARDLDPNEDRDNDAGSAILASNERMQPKLDPPARLSSPGDGHLEMFLIKNGSVLDATTTSGSPNPRCRGKSSLHLAAAEDANNPILKAQRGTYCLSQPVPDASNLEVVVQTQAAPYIEELKRQSTRGFLILVGTALVGLLIAGWLSRVVSVSLTRLSRVASETTNGVVVTDPDIRTLWANRAFSEITGYDRDEVVGRNPGHLLQGEGSSPETIARMRKAIRNEEPFTAEVLNYHRSGSPYWVEIACNPIRDHKGRLEGFIAVQTDVTRRKQSQLDLEDSEQRLRSLIDQFPGAVLFEGTDRRLIITNGAFTQTFRTDMTPQDLIGIDCQAAARQAAGQFINPAAFLARIEELIARNNVIHAEKVEMSDGHTYERDFIPVRSGTRTVGYLWLYRDVTEHTRVEEQLREAAVVFDNAAEGILITDPKGNIIEVNGGFERITGYKRQEVIGRNPRLLKSGIHDSAFYKRLFRGLETDGEWCDEVWNRRKNGDLFATRQTITAIRDPWGKIERYLSLFSDITELKQYQNRLEHIAYYDPLTDLPNRALLADRLTQAMSQTERRRNLVGVGFIDLDGFKQVNDTLGHDAGDELLRTIARRLSDVLRQGDTLARVGGDEFVAVLVDLSDRKVLEEVLKRMVEAASQPIELRDEMVSVSASIGAALYPQEHASDADQLVRQADQAMYSAKQGGKNRYALAEPPQDQRRPVDLHNHE